MGLIRTAIVLPSSLPEKGLLFTQPLYWIQAKRQILKEGWESRKVTYVGGQVKGDFVDWIGQVRYFIQSCSVGDLDSWGAVD